MVTVTFYSSAPTMLQISVSDMLQDLSITYIWKRPPKQWSNILSGISEQSEVRKIFSGHLFSDDLFLSKSPVLTEIFIFSVMFGLFFVTVIFELFFVTVIFELFFIIVIFELFFIIVIFGLDPNIFFIDSHVKYGKDKESACHVRVYMDPRVWHYVPPEDDVFLSVVAGLGVDSWRERAISEVQGLRDERGPTQLGIYTRISNHRSFCFLSSSLSFSFLKLQHRSNVAGRCFTMRNQTIRSRQAGIPCIFFGTF